MQDETQADHPSEQGGDVNTETFPIMAHDLRGQGIADVLAAIFGTIASAFSMFERVRSVEEAGYDFSADPQTTLELHPKDEILVTTALQILATLSPELEAPTAELIWRLNAQIDSTEGLVTDERKAEITKIVDELDEARVAERNEAIRQQLGLPQGVELVDLTGDGNLN